MAKDFESGLKNLLTLSHTQNLIVRTAAARAAAEILKDETVSNVVSGASPFPELIKSPDVTAELWIPERESALDLASQLPKRETILADLSHESLNFITQEFWKAAAPDYDPEQSDPYDRSAIADNAVKQISGLGERFEPDIRRLFLIYAALFRRATLERFEWFDLQARSRELGRAIVPGRLGALTTSWQLAWAASRKPVSTILEELGSALKNPSPKLQWAASQFLEEATRFENMDTLFFGGGSGPPLTSPFAEISREGNLHAKPPKGEPPPSPEPSEPPPRYTNVTFWRDKNAKRAESIPNEMTLQTQRWYWIEVAVRVEPGGIPSGEAEKPIRPVRQDKPVDLLVTIASKDFELDQNLGQITLPPQGDSTKHAYFRVRHQQLKEKDSAAARIEVRVFYLFNLLEHLTIFAKITAEEQMETAPVHGIYQEKLCRKFVDLDEFVPRAMHIEISQIEGFYQLEFTLSGKGTTQVALVGRTEMTEESFEDKLTRLRSKLQNLSLGEYLIEQEPGIDEFREAIWDLAEFGQELWLSLFSTAASGPDLELVGKALRERPIEDGGFVQVSLTKTGSRFVYPWAFLYDGELPDSKHKLPDLKGFWGYRYAIEQDGPRSDSDRDTPKEFEGKMRMAFMLWSEFPNAPDQKKLMTEFVSESQESIQIGDPVVSKEECYKLLQEGSDPILYFFAHGHCRTRQIKANFADLAVLVEAEMQKVEKESEAWFRLEALAARIKKQESDKSYIELSHGRLYYWDLVKKIKPLSSRPFVFLNMCESAEIIPFLREDFVSLFLALNASAVLGTECAISVNFAHPFSKFYLREVFRGETLADALRTARREFLEHRNPLGLAYTLFGSGALRFLPARLSTKKKRRRKLKL